MTTRMHKELSLLERAPPPGVYAWPRSDEINKLDAVITGPEGTPYETGNFELEVVIPDSYPNEPPKVRFITPVYHPNIDNGGRICLDSLKMPPKGTWTPSLNLSTLLTTIRLLLSSPNPDDPLMPDITEQYISHFEKFVETAHIWTLKHAYKSSFRPVYSQNSFRTEATFATSATHDVSGLNVSKKQPTILVEENGEESDESASSEEDIPKITKTRPVINRNTTRKTETGKHTLAEEKSDNRKKSKKMSSE